MYISSASFCRTYWKVCYWSPSIVWSLPIDIRTFRISIICTHKAVILEHTNCTWHLIFQASKSNPFLHNFIWKENVIGSPMKSRWVVPNSIQTKKKKTPTLLQEITLLIRLISITPVNQWLYWAKYCWSNHQAITESEIDNAQVLWCLFFF